MPASYLSSPQYQSSKRKRDNIPRKSSKKEPEQPAEPVPAKHQSRASTYAAIAVFIIIICGIACGIAGMIQLLNANTIQTTQWNTILRSNPRVNANFNVSVDGGLYIAKLVINASNLNTTDSYYVGNPSPRNSTLFYDNCTVSSAYLEAPNGEALNVTANYIIALLHTGNYINNRGQCSWSPP